MTTTEIIPAAGSSLEELLQPAARYHAARIAPSTRALYDRLWDQFSQWCIVVGQPSGPPTSPAVLAAYLGQRADSGRSPSTVACDAKAVAFKNTEAGFPDLRRHPDIRDVLTGIRRTKGVAPVEATPVLVDELRRMSLALTGERSEFLDRALLVLGWAGAFRRSELVAVRMQDIQRHADGLTIHVPRSKTDQEGQGRDKQLPWGSDPLTCPVRTLDAWLAVRHPAVGADVDTLLFTLPPRGRLQTRPVPDDYVARLVARLARRVGLTGGRYRAHSLRAGFATAAADHHPLDLIAVQTGHASLASVGRYVRRQQIRRRNAAQGLGL